HEAGCDSIRHTDADAAEGTGIEHLLRGQPDAREAEEIAAVDDRYRIIAEPVADRREHPVGVHAPVLAVRRAGHRVAQFGRALAMAFAHTFQPFAVTFGSTVAGGLRKRRKAFGRVREKFHGAATVVAHFG